MEILKQVMIFTKNILILHKNSKIRIVNNKINIHLGEIFINQKKNKKRIGNKHTKIKRIITRNNIKKKRKKNRKKERNLGMVDIQEVKRIFLENIIMVINKILRNKQGIKMLKKVNFGMIGNQNQLLILMIQKILIMIQYLISINLENIRRKNKNNTKNMKLGRIQILMMKIEDLKAKQMYFKMDGKAGFI